MVVLRNYKLQSTMIAIIMDNEQIYDDDTVDCWLGALCRHCQEIWGGARQILFSIYCCTALLLLVYTNISTSEYIVGNLINAILVRTRESSIFLQYFFFAEGSL